MSREMQKKQKDEEDLLRDIKKIVASLSYEEGKSNIQKR